MPKPKPKMPHLNMVMDSPQGTLFMHMLLWMVGPDLSWVPLERTKDKHDIFLLSGTNGSGVLVEAQECAEHECWRHQWGFRGLVPDAAGVIQVEMLAHRWDPWLSASKTGDHSLIEGPLHRRLEVERQKNREIGAQRDRVHIVWLPQADTPRELAGLPSETVDRILRKAIARR